ncbi:hypothetical protein TP47_19355 [Xanthomonas citri pv. aurantifolii]|nr:hypothetical protein TP37_17305 [Xanthomonas citri pv. aurantifolii]TBW94071.1 hypothetical protein TP47_19355 [Xanthomonas citri pv. aurantifolii]
MLRRRGCVDGERLAVLARNSVWQVALHFACGRVGAIYVPLNWRLSASGNPPIFSSRQKWS